jgi:hypothetical protein
MAFKKIYNKLKKEMSAELELSEQRINENQIKKHRSEGALLALEYMKQQVDIEQKKSVKDKN